MRLWVARVLCSVWRNRWYEVEGVVWESLVLHMSFPGFGSGSFRSNLGGMQVGAFIKSEASLNQANAKL